MATTPQQGIMALPETDEASTPQLSLNESYGAAKEGLADANPQYAAMYDDEMAKAMPALMALTDEQLDAILQLVQEMQNNPEQYAENLKELEQEGIIEKGDFPEQYDENFLAVFGAAILEAQRTNEDTGAAAPAMQPPMQLAKGGIAEAARMVASHGRSGDTMLAHITKDEAALLKKHGGVGTRNPRTGLREYGLWSSIKGAVSSVAGGLGITKALSTVGKAVKGVLNSTVGRIVATVALAAFLGPAGAAMGGGFFGTTAAMGLASAGVTALSGGNLKDVVKAGVTGTIAGFGAEVLGPALGTATGVSNAAGQAAMGAGAASTGTGLLQGKSIKDSVKDGMTAAAISGLVTGTTQGFDAQVKPNNAPVTDRSITPQNAADVNVNAQTGQVTGGAPTTTQGVQPLASSNSAFEQALANAKQPPINGLTMDSGTTVTGVQSPINGLTMDNGLTVTGATPSGTAPLASSNQAFDQALANSGAGTGTGGAGVTGETGAGKGWWDKTSDYFSPSARAQAGALDAGKAYDAAYKATLQQGGSEAAAKIAADAAAKSATPGMLSNYGPAVGAGLGITALAGGFSPSHPTVSQETKDRMSGKATQDIINANPSSYYTQNLPGVTYDASGNITGSTSWTPRSGSGATEVAGNYVGYSRPQAPQGYNFMPRYAAGGGFMENQGAFPQNPLAMDQGPLMAMDSHQMPMNTSGMPMNTPGVPMNRPMGLAMGGMPMGIASLSVGGYPRRNGQISGPGTETSDDIPAMLSDGEFVMTAKAVRGLGQGSRREGAKKMYALMHHLEKNAARG